MPSCSRDADRVSDARSVNPVYTHSFRMSRMKKEEAAGAVGVELVDDEFSLWNLLLITGSIV